MPPFLLRRRGRVVRTLIVWENGTGVRGVSASPYNSIGERYAVSDWNCRGGDFGYDQMEEFIGRGLGHGGRGALLVVGVLLGYYSWKKKGLRECGRFDRTGRKNGRDFDVIGMQKLL